MARRQVSIFINGRSVENTLKGIRSEKTKINNELQNMTIGTEEYQKKAAELRKINKIMGDHYEGIKGTESAYDKLRKGAGQFLSIAAASFTAETIISYGAELFRLGTEMEVLTQKAKVVFAEALPAVTLEAEKNATAMGLTTSAYIDAATSIGDLLIPMGFARQEAADISTNLVNLSGALAEWTGGQVEAEEVTRILGKAMLGEREELKQLGIAINEADVQARLAEKGLKDLTGEMLQQAKAAATLELITEKSADAQAAFAQNADTLVRKQAELRAQFQAVNERLATALIPTFSRLLGGVLSLSDAVGDLFSGLEDATKAFDDQQAKVNNLESELLPLLTRYDELQGKSILTTDEQEELRKVIEKIGEITPTAITEINKYGTVLGINADASRDFLKAEQARLEFVNKEAIASIEEEIASLEKRRQLQQTYFDIIKEGVTEINRGGVIQTITPEDITEARKELGNLTRTIEGAQAQLARLRGEQPTGGTGGDPPPPISPTPEEIAEAKRRAKELAEQRKKQAEELAEQRKKQAEEERKRREREAEQELKEQERLLQRLADNTAKFQEEARLAAMTEDEAQLERIRLQFDKQIEIAKELERRKVEEATSLRIELERLQQEALQEARFEQNEALIETEMDLISNQIDAELELEEEKTERILAEIDRRHDAEARKRREKQAEEIAAQKEQFTEIASVAGAASDIIGSALQLVGDEAAKNSAQGKILALIQIGLKTAEGIASAVAAGAGIPFPGNLPAIASGIAAVTTGIAGARQALQGTPPVPQRKEGGYVSVRGQDDGILYHARYVGRRKTGMISGGPALVDTVSGPVLANERGAEYFVNHRALQNPVVMDHVRAIDNIVRMRQFQTGGFTSPPDSPSEPSGQAAALPTKELQEMTAAVQRLNGILSSGIYAVIDDDSVVDLRNRTQKLIDASGGVI